MVDQQRKHKSVRSNEKLYMVKSPVLPRLECVCLGLKYDAWLYMDDAKVMQADAWL
jgi:hypothetical protein